MILVTYSVTNDNLFSLTEMENDRGKEHFMFLHNQKHVRVLLLLGIVELISLFV